MIASVSLLFRLMILQSVLNKKHITFTFSSLFTQCPESMRESHSLKSSAPNRPYPKGVDANLCVLFLSFTLSSTCPTDMYLRLTQLGSSAN